MDDVLEKQKIDHEDSAGQKRIVLRLRWGIIIITSFLLIFARDHTFPQPASSLLVLTYLFSNVIASCLPPYYFVRFSFLCIVLLFDTLMITLGIYLSSRFDTDFYLIYFLIMLFASVGRSLKLLVLNASVICGIYTWMLWSKGWDLKWLEQGVLLRIPFIFIVNLFYGFVVQSYEDKTKKISTELKEVEESERRYRQIVEGAHDAVAVLDEQGCIRFSNGRLSSLTQYGPEELIGMEAEKVVIGPGREEMTKDRMICEAEVLRKDGERRKVEVSASRFFLPTGQVHAVLYLKDVTEKRRIEEGLVQSEKLRAIGEMAAGIAHDFNNVLGAILGRAQLIKLEMMTRKTTAASMSEEAIRKDLEVIERAATDGAHTVRKILDFTRSKSDESLFFPLDVNEVVDGAIDLARTKIKDEAQATGIQIEVQTIRNQVRPVMGNPSELREVLLNLIFNAIDAMPKGGTILFKTGMENGSVLIEVKDSGVGMSESDRSRIFDPFFTTKGVQGSGLGLCVSYAIIQHHHGEIRAESQQGAGTTFLIKLPVAKS